MTHTVDRGAIRDEAIVLLERLREELGGRGYQRYREGELLHPDTGKHVRIGYASDEWIITIGVLHGHSVVTQDTHRMDLRLIGPDRALPALPILTEWIEGV